MVRAEGDDGGLRAVMSNKEHLITVVLAPSLQTRVERNSEETIYYCVTPKEVMGTLRECGVVTDSLAFVLHHTHGDILAETASLITTALDDRPHMLCSIKHLGIFGITTIHPRYPIWSRLVDTIFDKKRSA